MSARRTRQAVYDVRDAAAELRDCLNEADVRIGHDYVVLSAEEFDRLQGRLANPAAPAPGKARSTDPGTSQAAAVNVFPRSGTQRWKLLIAIYEAGPDGLTSEEASSIAGVSFSRSSGPRLAELKEGGWIEPTGRVRPGTLAADQEVLVVTERGRTELELRL